MGKFSSLVSQIFSIFGSSEWLAENINTVPQNVTLVNSPNEYVRISIIPSKAGINTDSVAGILIADIFTKAGDGPTSSYDIADRLDSYLAGNTITLGKESIQFYDSTLTPKGVDTDNPTLFRTSYTINFNFFWSY